MVSQAGPAQPARRRFVALLAVSSAPAWLAGCVSLPRAVGNLPSFAPDTGWAERRSVLQQLDGFSLRGRIAIAAGESGASATMRWVQAGARGEIEFDGPLGIGGLRVVARGEQLSVTNARGERRDGAAARADLERQLGFELPLASLRYWVLGVPDPSRDVDEERLADDAPRLEALSQAGWQVAYRAYTGAAGLPRRIDAARGAARLRLLVEEWAGQP